MIVYDLRCESGHRFRAGLESMFDDNPDCPECGGVTQRIPANPRLGGRADPGPSRDQMPKSWKAISGGHPEAVAAWREKIVHRDRLEEKYPELAGDRRPVLAHEGIFRDAPLRAGDDVRTAVRTAVEKKQQRTDQANTKDRKA